MSQNLSPQSPLQPLSIGNVVSAGLRIYRSHFKSYLWLAIQASLWLILPFLLMIPVSLLFAYFQANPLTWLIVIPILIALLIYGFAKYYAFSALISRLAFGELVNQPESVKTAQDKIKPHLWSFFWVNTRIVFLLALLYLGLSIVGGIFTAILSPILISTFGQAGYLLSLIPMGIIIFFGLTWYFSRWLVAEVPLAVEEGVKVGQSMDRSWELSKNSAFRIQAIVFIAFLITLPLLLLTNYIPSLFILRVQPGSTEYWIINFISLIVSLLVGALTLPLWQAIKAVLYYDLRSRREGLGLKLRDR